MGMEFKAQVEGWPLIGSRNTSSIVLGGKEEVCIFSYRWVCGWCWKVRERQWVASTLFFFLRCYLFILELGEGSEKERERNMDV